MNHAEKVRLFKEDFGIGHDTCSRGLQSWMAKVGVDIALTLFREHEFKRRAMSVAILPSVMLVPKHFGIPLSENTTDRGSSAVRANEIAGLRARRRVMASLVAMLSKSFAMIISKSSMQQEEGWVLVDFEKPCESEECE